MSDAIVGPFAAFFKAHGRRALLLLLAITLFQLPNFVSGPMYSPMYVDVGLTKTMVGTIRGTFGIVGVYLGVAVGGFLPLRLGLTSALLLGGAGQITGHGADPDPVEPGQSGASPLFDQTALEVR